MTAYKYNRGQTIVTDVPRQKTDRFFGAHLVIAAADTVATSDTAVLAATAMTAEAQVITEDITSPDVPRALRIKGNASGITGDVVFAGTNILDEAITETIALNGSTAVDGVKAFKTIISATLPVEVHAGTDTVSVGFCDKLGLPYMLDHNTVLMAFRNKVREATAPTVTTSATAIEGNTIKLASALNETQVDIYLMV